MADSDDLHELQLDRLDAQPPKEQFDDLRSLLLKTPQIMQKENREVFRTLFYWCTDQKKHARIIHNLFWPIIMSLVQDKNNNKISLFGLKALNQLLTNDGSLDEVIKVGRASRLQEQSNIKMIIRYFQYNSKNRDGSELTDQEKAQLHEENIRTLNSFIESRQNPIHILVRKMMDTNSQQIIQEVSKAIRNLSQADVVIETLQENNELIDIIESKFLYADPVSQENILESVSFACKFVKYREKFADNDKFLDILLSQVQSISLKVTYFTIKIARQLSKDKLSIEKIQGQNLRLTEKLIVAFKWLDEKVRVDEVKLKDPGENYQKEETKGQGENGESPKKGNNFDGTSADKDKGEIFTLVFQEISKCFQYILKYYETHKKLLEDAQTSDKVKNHSIETDIIETIVKLGKQTRDYKTQLNAATCLAHITEVLHCNPMVASHDAIDFMIDMLKDAKHLKLYRQGCRYFANLSFYKDFRDTIIRKEVGNFLLKAIDGHLDDDTIKHSAIALANLSSHKEFMRVGPRTQGGGDHPQSSKAEKFKIKPLIHLLDSAQRNKINLIQSACITLCNMASKPQLHTHFIYEPEISTIKNCLANPIDKNHGNELIRFMIKLVCNLTKNPDILPNLSKKGFLEILFDLLNHETQREIFGNVVTAISYLSQAKECQEKIINNKIIPRILEPLTQIHEVDQKMIIIALTSMLFNGIDIQREFIKHGGLGKLLFFMQQKDKIFQQLACKCFSLLSENQQNLQEILDQECLNTIIISCLRTKDIDLETLKEITKIFINLILWRKISKDTFETTCCLCDIGLMIDDQDMNILAIFCLNALSENEESHEKIRNSGVNFGLNTLDANRDHDPNLINSSSAITAGDRGENAGAGSIDQVGYNSQSIFNRINYLLEFQEQRVGKDRQEQLDKQALIVTLITSFYLNLARNEANIDFLLKLKLFKRLNQLMQSNIRANNVDSTALCYTNTIFSKLLKNNKSLTFCVDEKGYELFISILQSSGTNKHLFLETLDSIKLFLSRRDYLGRFKDIPKCFKLEREQEYRDLDVSFLQVLAILSFEKENHDELKDASFLDRLTQGEIFHIIFAQFDQLVENKKNLKKKANAARAEHQNVKSTSPVRTSRFGPGNPDNSRERSFERNDAIGGGALAGNMSRPLGRRGKGKTNVNRRNRIRENQDKNRSEELTLAVSIILANLSSDEQFLETLLGVDQWEKIDSSSQDNHMQAATAYSPAGGLMGKNEFDVQADEDRTKDDDYNALFKKKMFHQKQELMTRDHKDDREDADARKNPGCYANYNDEQLRKDVYAVDRITRLFNLLSHDNIYIAEQIAILMANVSNSPYFRHIFVTDRCMKSLLKILRDQNTDQVARVSQLAALIVVLNLTSMNDIVVGMENMKFMQTLQDIIKDDHIPNVNKSIALLAISNIQTVSKNVMTLISAQTKDFAFQVLLNWKQKQQDGESEEVVKNLVYASLILFYNLILKKIGTPETISQLINVICDHVLQFDDPQIINVVLELITLFTRSKDTSDYIFQKQLILNYVFEKLKCENQETLRLAALALSRLAARLDEYNSDLFIKNLADFKKDFIHVIANIKALYEQINKQQEELKRRQQEEENNRTLKLTAGNQKGKQGNANQGAAKQLSQEAREAENQVRRKQLRAINTQIDCILRYFLNFLENITSFKKIRETLDCPDMFDNMKDLYTEDIIVYSKISLISIIFNLNFNLQEPKPLSKEFLKMLYKTYKDELKDDEKTRRKIITIVVSASALEANHKAIIKSNFYTQFKRNINDFYAQLVDQDEEVELFGLVNIVLNQNYMHLIYQDLKKIHKIALKNNKIEFKTKVDLFLECSKFLAKLSASDDDENIVAIQGGVLSQNQPANGENDVLSNQMSPSKKSTNLKMNYEMDNKSEMIDCCLKALLFSLIKIIGLLDTNNFSMFKYFLIAILDCSSNLKSHLIYLIKIENLIEFLKRVLKEDFVFNMKDFDDQVLNFSLRIIVCEIFFNLKQEKYFFKLENIAGAIQLLIQFAQKVIKMNIEKKMFLVSNTLRLMSQMITQIHTMPEAHQRVMDTQSIDFVKDALTLSKDLYPCINIDALFCLTNMMNIRQLAIDETLGLCCAETVNNAMVIYFAYNHQVELDECIITFLYTISKYKEYQNFMKDKSKVLYLLMERQFEQKYETTTDTSRQKIFSLFHNMTENEEICQQLNAKRFIDLTNKMLQQTSLNKYSADHIHELALKSIINMSKNATETFEEADLKGFLINICSMYGSFKNLSKQYALRLITILTKQWQVQKIQDFLQEIIEIMSQFIENCESVIELKLVIINLEKIASSKQLMKSLADLTVSCKKLIRNIHLFIAKNTQKKDYHSSIEQLFRFCKKLSKQHKAQVYLVNEKIHEICLRYISENLDFKESQKDDQALKQILTTIQNIMKMIKNIFDGNISHEQQSDIFVQVTKCEQIITDSDQLLNNYKDSENKDELAIIIVNIIICYNSISKKLDSERVKSWIQTFSERLIAASKKDFNKEEQARSWYMEKYVLIIELLVTKNLDKIDGEMTYQLLKIYDIKDTKYFTNTIWYKLMKILAHLQNIQDMAHRDYLENIMQFILLAYDKAQENLCFFYFMKIVLLIVKKFDNNQLIEKYKQYNDILTTCIDFLKLNCNTKNDPLILEILLYIIDMLNFLMKFHFLHEKLNDNDVVSHLIQMLSVHENAFIMKALSSVLLESSKITAFYPDLLSDTSLSIFLNKMLNYQGEPDSLSNMFDCLRNIIQQTKTPIKYLLSTSILKITEDNTIQWQSIQENNIYCLLKVLNYNIRFLSDEEEEMKGDGKSKGGPNRKDKVMNQVPIKTTSEKIPTPELLQELQQKALKYSIMAITNILIQTNKDLIFYRKLSILSILQENCKFEVDPQMNLRLLYLLNISLTKQQKMPSKPAMALKQQADLKLNDNPIEEPIPEKAAQDNTMNNPKASEITQQSKEIQSQATISLVNFLLENIYKFKSIIQIKDQSFFVDIPKLSEIIHQDEENQTINDEDQAQSRTGGQSSPSLTSFFFEAENYELNKISGIRLSLCLSLRILYKLAVSKKKIACQAIIDNKMSQDLFYFFIPYVENGDKCCLKQVRQVIKIIQNCSDFVQLHCAILDRESITSLIRLAEKAINDDFTELDYKYQQKMQYGRNAKSLGYPQKEMGYSQKNESQRKIIIPILKIFISLCSTPQFHWHLSKYNAIDLLNRIRDNRDKDDDYIADVAKEVCEKVIDHHHETQMNNSLNPGGLTSGASSGALPSQINSAANHEIALAAEYDLQAEIAAISGEQNLTVAKNSVINLEKMLIQKKLKLDSFNSDCFDKLVKFFEKILTQHSASLRADDKSEDELTNSQLRRIIIKSLLVILNFVYSKKYLKDIISGYSQPIGAAYEPTETDIFAGSRKQQKNTHCVMEDSTTLKLFKDLLFQVVKQGCTYAQNHPDAGKPAANSGQATAGKGNAKSAAGSFGNINQGFQTFVDFRDINEEVIYLFCSYAMSMNFTTEQICGFILPLGQQILDHCIYSIQKSQEVSDAKADGSDPQTDFQRIKAIGDSQCQTSVTTICSLSSINAALESIVIILRNPKRNIEILQNFDLAQIINQIIQIIRIFDLKAPQDLTAKEQFESKIHNLTLNLELVIKLIFFSPQALQPGSIKLIHSLLIYKGGDGTPRYIKTGIFSIYCTALMIQDQQNEAVVNLMPVFNDEKIMKALFEAISDVDTKYEYYKAVKGQSQQSVKRKDGQADIVEPYAQQTKANLAQGNKQLKEEIDAKREFDEAVNIRKSCLQILIVIVEFLSNAIIKNGRVFIETKTKNMQNQPGNSNSSRPGQAKSQASAQELAATSITPQQHDKLTQLIYHNKDLLELIYKCIIMRIPDSNQAAGLNQAASINASKESMPQSHEKYLPGSEEIKLAARALASMPLSIIKRKNPPINVELQRLDSEFSISGYFKALWKIIENGYGNIAAPYQPSMLSNPNLMRREEEAYAQERTLAKQATYFALYALLEFVVQVPLAPSTDSSGQGNLDRLAYGQLMTCLIKTGLLQRVLQLPNSIEVNSTDEEPIIRLCMKVLICTIFKGQNAMGQNFKFTEGNVPENVQSVFEESGMTKDAERHKVMGQFQQMIQKIHHFEIAQIHKESYVQYLHLLSQITVNTQEVQSIGTGTEHFTSDREFLIKNIQLYAEKCIQEDQRKKLINSKETGQKNIIYQFFFINYLLSICIPDVVQKASQASDGSIANSLDLGKKKDKNQAQLRSISQKIFIILIKLLEALNDPELNEKLDKIIAGRIQVLKKAEERQLQMQESLEKDSQATPSAKKGKKADGTQDEDGENASSAIMTITKMILFNMFKLFKSCKLVQEDYYNGLHSKDEVADAKGKREDMLTHKLQVVNIEEDQLDLLVKLLQTNEQNGEIVNKVYEILQLIVDVSKTSTQASTNIHILDMSKSLLQISIKHSSIYQCENAFKFLYKLVMQSEKYQNKQDIQFSLGKIMPAGIKDDLEIFPKLKKVLEDNQSEQEDEK